jgi:hypothetical protein
MIESAARANQLPLEFFAVLAGHDPGILGITLRRPGTPTFYQVRVGAETRKAAAALC